MDKTFRLWDLRSGRLLATMKADGSVQGVAFGPDGHWGLGATLHGIDVLDLDRGEKLRSFEHDQEIGALALSPDGRIALSGNGDPFAPTILTLTLWDVASGKPLAHLIGHDNSGVYTVAIGADGRFALSGGYDRTVRLWDIQTRKQIWQMNGH